MLRSVLAVLLVVLEGCSSSSRRPVPIEMMEIAQVPGMPNVRVWGDELSDSLQDDMAEAMRQEWAAHPDRGPDIPRDYEVLALSGGGASGAFGAGFLCGWTETGTRPEFKLVTGVSTGALIAPAAFLGPEYDSQIRRVFTETKTRDVFSLRNIISWLWSDSVADSKPLEQLIRENLDEEVFNAVAAEHRRGRRLFIGTTNLDAGRFVIWNMGAIADSKQPDAIDLFRKVMLASASIPAMLPPVRIDVEIGGINFDEIHVDGGTVAQVFFYEFTMDPNNVMERLGMATQERRSSINVHVLYNGKLKATPELMSLKLPQIVERSLGTLMRARAIGDIYRIYIETKRHRINMRYLDIPMDYVPKGKEMFDPEEMQRLFQVGFDLAKGEEDPWRTIPPGFSEDPLPWEWVPKAD